MGRKQPLPAVHSTQAFLEHIISDTTVMIDAQVMMLMMMTHDTLFTDQAVMAVRDNSRACSFQEQTGPDVQQMACCVCKPG